jgi:hypothetical protein
MPPKKRQTEATSEAPIQKKFKSKFFKEDEIEIIIDEVQKNKKILFTKFNPSITKSLKDKTWKGITQKVNAAGSGSQRTYQQVMKKWSDFQCLAKKKNTQRKKNAARTGGGQIKDEIILTDLERKALSILGELAIVGHPSAIDSATSVAATEESTDHDTHTQGNNDLAEGEPGSTDFGEDSYEDFADSSESEGVYRL